MKGCLLIGGFVVAAGVFVGFVAYKILKENPELLKNAKKKMSNVGQKTSKIAVKAKQAFAEGFKEATAKAATA